MAKAILNTITKLLKSGSTLGIYTYFSDTLQEIVAFISDSVFGQDGVDFLENELGYSKVGYDDVSFFLNEMGELIVKADDPDKFAIDSDGYLTIDE